MNVAGQMYKVLRARTDMDANAADDVHYHAHKLSHDPGCFLSVPDDPPFNAAG